MKLHLTKLSCGGNISHYPNIIGTVLQLCDLFFIMQGETFEVAEVVQFRLTHNMVHALVRVNHLLYTQKI